jgi:hypothetical protein
MKLAYRLIAQPGGKYTQVYPSGTVYSVGPDGTVQPPRPSGTAGPYELCTLNGAVLLYEPTPGTVFMFVPEA